MSYSVPLPAVDLEYEDEYYKINKEIKLMNSIIADLQEFKDNNTERYIKVRKER